MISENVDPSEIGIISPYRKQTTKLRQMMAALHVDTTNMRIGSVEEFQVGTGIKDQIFPEVSLVLILWYMAASSIDKNTKCTLLSALNFLPNPE
jgi:hypothetical protein